MNRGSLSILAVLTLTSTACSSAQGLESNETTTTTGRVAVTTTSQAVATTTTATPVPTTISDPTVVLADDLWIVYQGGSGGDQIFLIRPDGTGAHSPTEEVSGYGQTNPDWSPDGQRIVFAVANQNGTEDLRIVNADGTEATVALACVDPCQYFDDPAWSPDGTMIVFTRMTEDSDGVRSTLETLNVATKDTEIILDAGPTDFYAGPRWSPDGKSIVLEVVHRTGPAGDAEVTGVTLSVIDLTTTPPTVRPLTEPELYAETADWSEDGTLIVFASLGAPGHEAYDLYTIHPDGSDLTRLTTLASSGGNVPIRRSQPTAG
ncbi:MAG: PD40 domain-containing protein [Acidimicrobiia bacterium]|nr:PD40 domain-containing protein [Acidimicrobiia bacterium]